MPNLRRHFKSFTYKRPLVSECARVCVCVLHEIKFEGLPLNKKKQRGTNGVKKNISLTQHEERNTDFFFIKGKTFIFVFHFDVYNL